MQNAFVRQRVGAEMGNGNDREQRAMAAGPQSEIVWDAESLERTRPFHPDIALDGRILLPRI
jgi:hypothetical protein